MDKATLLAPALGRLLLSLIFIMGGFGKLFAAAGTKAYIASAGLPVPDLAYLVAVALELGGGILLLVGFQTRWIAVALALFCLVTGFVFHLKPGDQMQTILLMKNLAIAGGLLLAIGFGAGALSVDTWLAQRGRAAPRPA